MIFAKAWAKINFGLKIVGKRDDGFHDIETTLVTINLSDLIKIEETEADIVVEAKGIDIPQKENLCYQAADVFRKRFNITKGVKISLTKNVPVGGGLGGGSSDAACVLKGMSQLFNLNVLDEELTDLSKSLGSDVPFFIKGGAAHVRGKGDELKYFKLPRMSFILYWPGYPISTKWAYEEYDKTSLTPLRDTDIVLEMEKKKEKKKKPKPVFNLVNDFERVIFKTHPDLLDVKTHLLAAGAFIVSLSGSGSCLYTVIDENIKKKVVKYLDGIGAQYFEVVTI